MTTCNLNDKHCKPCEGGVPALTKDQALKYLADLPDWQLSSDDKAIIRKFEFKGFNKTMGFINAMAWIVNQEMHHPDVKFGYDFCEITFTTHAIDGLSENDFICASKVTTLLD